MDIVELLENRNIKKTLQRLSILKIIEDLGHSTIEMIYSKIKKEFPTMSLATIYKNVDYLKKEGILKQLNIGNKDIYYEIDKKMHYHIIEDGIIKDVNLDIEIIQKLKNVLNLSDKDILELQVYK